MVLVKRIIRVLCNIVTMECSSEIVNCSHAHIKGRWAKMRFKMACKFKTTTNYTSQRITDITHSQSEYIRDVADEYNP